MRLLLVEDDRELAQLIERALHTAGFEVTRAADGQRALHLGADRGRST